MTTIQIRNGRFIDPKSGTDAKKDVFIADGRIVAIGRAPAGFQPGRLIDAAGLVVAPGFVDLSARLREPGFEHKATLESEMQAAAAGGVTSLACPPDTDPPLDEPGLVEMLKFRARNLNQAHVYPIGALTLGLKGTHLTEMAELTDAGCVAFSHADAPLTDTQLLLRALQYAATFDFAVWLRPRLDFNSTFNLNKDPNARAVAGAGLYGGVSTAQAHGGSADLQHRHHVRLRSPDYLAYRGENAR